MNDVAMKPGVALLFADAELGAHLRDALAALGVRIVHEGAPADVTREALAASGAGVVVVNLEASEEAYLDRLHEVLASGPYQVVFNDAEASRNLAGWDRARWARHLAAKLVGSSDVDPPRPTDARGVEGAAPASSEPTAPAGEGDAPPAMASAAPVAAAALDADGDMADGAASEEMAAELEQLLTDVQAADAGGAAERDADADGANALTAGDPASDEVPALDDDPAGREPANAAATGALALAPDAPAPVAGIEERKTIGDAPGTPDWDLVDFDASAPSPAPAAPQSDSRDFGVEKVRAEDYLAPDTTLGDSPIEPANELELVSLEESIAPTMYDEPVSEMLLGEGMDRIHRVVVVGVGADETAAAGSFLAGLPASLPAVVLIVQHQLDKTLDELVATLDVATDLPVRVVREGSVARQGQAWLVPAGQTCRLERSGAIKLDAVGTTVLGDPSIDECLASIAGTFDADVTAVVLAGSGYDALAGAQEVHDHGGRVWVQDPATCGDDAMATAIRAEGLATCTGTPEELARRLAGEHA